MAYQLCNNCGTYVDDGGWKDGKFTCHECLDQEE